VSFAARIKRLFQAHLGQSRVETEAALRQIFDAHRLMIELRAAQKLNAGKLESNGLVLVSADDI
jgi:hypothetical protein